MADSLLPAGTPPIQPLGLLGDTPQPVPVIGTEVAPTSTLKPITQVSGAPAPADPFSGFQDANFDQFQDAPAAPDAFAHFKSADDLDVKSVDELNADRTNFNPVTYFSSNPDAAKDPKKLQKLLDVYRKRREEGLVAGEVVKAAVKDTPGLVANIGGGIKRIGERAIDLTVQPISNVVLGALTGDLFDKQKRDALFNETRKVIKKGTAEVSAGAESANVGIVDLSRQGLRKLDAAYTPTPLSAMGDFSPQESIPLKKPLTDQELLRDISDDVAFRQNAAEILTGQGESAKNFGLDKETLAKQGVELDEKAIEQLSLVDPITMVATGGAFKLVGAAGKVLGTARTLEGIQYASGKLADFAKYAAGKGIQYSGAATKAVGKALQGTGGSAALITGVGSAVRGAGTVEALAMASAAKLTGPAVRFVGAQAEHFGKAIAGEVAVSATAQKVLDYASIPGRAAKEITKGAFTGIAAAAPFAIAADEDSQAGALLGAGAALGAAHAAGAGAFRVVKDAASRRYFGENRPVLEDVPSPGYGKEPELDAKHTENIQKLSAQDASEVNNFREGLRQQGGEIYAVDASTWRKEMDRLFPDMTQEQKDIYQNHSAFFDVAKGPDRHVVYLNVDVAKAGGLRHDAGHIFDAVLAPAKRAELRTAVKETFGQKAIDDFKDTYQRRVGNKISDAAALDEFIAEQFNALFYNVPVTELNAPKSLLTKFIDTAAEGAEALGIDLSAGAASPNLGAPVAVGIRKLFQNAAGDVIRAKIEGVPAKNVTPVHFGGEPPSRPTAPPTAPVVPPAAPPSTTPIVPGSPEHIQEIFRQKRKTEVIPGDSNLRVTPEEVAGLKQQPQTHEARAAAAARAEETGIKYARTEAKKAEGSPTSQIIERISDSMESGNPVIGIEHLGVTSESTPASPLGDIRRSGEQSSAYQVIDAEATRLGLPPEVVSLHSKNFVPIRWFAGKKNGQLKLLAMSLDKVLANAKKVAAAAIANPQIAELIPYPFENGKITPEGWKQLVADGQVYSENQSNGRKGDGGRLNVPEAGLSIPVENPNYTPKPLSPERANFQNLLQGLETPLSNKGGSKGGGLPGNIKGQLLAEANLRTPETPARIEPKKANKQAYIDFPGRTVKEVNPLRNEFERRGFNHRDLLKVAEEINAKDIQSATPRPDINYKAPVTDIIRGGFLPAPTEFRQKNLGGRTVEEFSDYVLKSSPEEFKAATDNMTGGLTGGAWNLGLGLKDAADVGVLKSYQGKLSDAAKAAMQAGDFDGAYAAVGKGQFFREAYEAATGTGSAGAAFKRGTAGMESAKPPFPIEATTTGTTSAAGPGTTETAKFQPQAEPALQLDLGNIDQTPELKIVPRAGAAAGGTPPIEPPAGSVVSSPSFRPPPVAAGVAQTEEQKAKFAPAPDKKIQDLAKDYADNAGIPYAPKGGYAEVKPDLAKKLADFYEKAKSDPKNPEVAASYDALIKETEDQGKAILAAGYKIEPWTGEGEPYKSSASAIADVRDNKHLFFRKTSDSFGTGESNVGNPMLAESNLVPGQSVNDVFRWVHDFFGHSKEGFQFGPRGEFNAWRAHSEMYSPEAQGALAAETLAQNSWVNYGPHLEGKNIPLAERPFAEQKNVVVPKELIDEATFQPRTEAGRKLEEKGYEIVASGEMGIRRVSVVKDGDEFAAIQSVQRSPKRAEIAMVQKYKGAPKGIGEVLYRELGAQLKDDGVSLVEGQVISPEPLAIRKKIFGGFASLDVNGEPASYAEALAASARVENRSASSIDVVEPVNRITADTRFLPGKRDAQGRPLDKEGNIDYVKWQKEGIAAVKKQRAEPIEASTPKGPVTEDSGSATGWILPDKKFVPLDAAFHEQYLANNAEALNKKFGTEFSDTASPDDRLAAVNAGFVRLRNQGGRLSVEANADKWSSLKSKVLSTLQDRSGKFDSLSLSLLNDKGQQVDSTSALRLHEMTGPEKQNAIEEAVSSVRASGPRFLPVGEYWMDREGEFIKAPKGHFIEAEKILGTANAEEPTRKDLYQQMYDKGYTRIISGDEGMYVDSPKDRLSDLNPAQRAAIEDEVLKRGQEVTFNGRRIGGAFQPAGEGLPGFEDISVEQAGRLKAKRRIAAVKKNNPEAVTPQYARDEAGEIIVTADGNPKPLTLDYDFINSPVAKEAAKGLKGAAREEAAAEAIGNKLVDFYKEAEKNPDLKAGSKWYSTARTRLRGVFGDDSKFFAELLGATSARTPVATNYRFALDAYNQFKAGAYDKTLAKYREGKAAWDAQELGDFKGETRGQFIDFWVKKHDLGVTQASGKKFGMNSRAVLRVLDGSWAAEVKGPKTPNFAGNLTGETYESTVDVWAARTLHRLANEGKKDRWRILPENETGVTDSDFYFGQAAYRHAAKKLGVKPDSVQSVLWFAEKKHWEDRGWTRGAGAELSDFNVLLKETEKTPTGMKMKTPQQEFGLDTEASIGDIVKKKR